MTQRDLILFAAALDALRGRGPVPTMTAEEWERLAEWAEVLEEMDAEELEAA